MEKHFKHTPVMLNECLEGLAIREDGIYVDGTFGGGGHSGEILKRLTTGKLIAIDKDDDALENGKKKFEGDSRIVFVKSDFKNLREVLTGLGIEGVDGILLDLGVSSYQLDTAERGFSYRFDAPLDMRMDQTKDLTAKKVVNSYSEKELLKILYEYGEEQNAKKIVGEIIKQRAISPIETTGELSELIEKVYPKKFANGRNVATKTFQAIRIEVNHELEDLEEALTDMAGLLNKNGRFAIITFHSLEDRAVKNVFKLMSTDCICDKRSPICVCGHKAELKLVNKKPIIPTDKEQMENKRSTSAKLRVAEKI